MRIYVVAPVSNSLQPPSPDAKEQERGSVFRPKFGADGLVTAVAVDDSSGDILMLAHMNAEALAANAEALTASLSFDGIGSFFTRSPRWMMRRAWM